MFTKLNIYFSESLLNAKRPLKCGDSICLSNETCEYPLVKCAADAVCIPPPPKCFPKPGVDPIEHHTKCGNSTCKPGEDCITILINCLEGAVCTPPPPKCVPKPVNENEPVNPCSTVLCKPNETCKTITYTCKKAPCRPTSAKCIPINPCTYTTCLEGYDCIPSEEDPTVAECKPRDLCLNVRCKSGYKCNVVTLYCFVLPCPPPYAECVPINPCATTTCSAGNVCTQNEDDPSVAECLLTPCAVVRCSTPCQAITEDCISPPCSRPKAQCVPLDDPNPCAKVNCRAGYTCNNVPFSCEEPPCAKFRSVCEPLPENPCDSNPCAKGSKCIFDGINKAVCSPVDACDGKVCNKGQECKITVFPCFNPPCPRGPRCVPKQMGK